MLWNNLSHCIQYLRRNPVFSLINVAGLVIGITGALFIFIYVRFELSFDRFHEDYENIYHVVGIDAALGVTSNNVGITMPPLGPAMLEQFPEVEKSVRYQPGAESLVTYDDVNLYIQSYASTDNNFFDVFNYPLLARQGGELLDQPNSVVVTESFARRLFGDDQALGKIFRMDNTPDLEVVGIVADPPPNSHLQFELLLSLLTSNPADENGERKLQFLDNWGVIALVTYVKLFPGSNEEAVEEKLTNLMSERSVMKTFSATLQPLSRVHLYSPDILFDNYNYAKGDIQNVIMLSSVAVFLLVIAAFNFMNLSTARSSLRAKEVGLRKTYGATRTQLILQFMQESLFLVTFAALLSLGLLKLLEPVVSLPLEGSFLASLFDNPVTWISAIGLLLLLGLMAGSYPAFVLSSFSPITVLKGKFANTGKGKWLRRSLVVVQFAVSIAIIIGMLIVNSQLQYMKNSDPGFVRDGIVNLHLRDRYLRETFAAALNNELLAIPGVISVATSSNMPGETFGRSGLRPDPASEDFFIMSALRVDSGYFDTLSMEMAGGRNFSPANTSDPQEALIFNESAVKALGWKTDEAVGKSLPFGPNQRRTVVGVVKDFHFASMRHQIEPVMIFDQEGPNRVVSVRIDRNTTRETLDQIQAAWERVNPNHPYEIEFFTDQYERLFEEDDRFSSMLFQFTFIAIIIACLGLYGLASFTADQKKKDVGIRKVLGAKTGQIVRLILKEYVLLILAANVVAWGVSWYVMNNWLSGFVYRIDMTALPFVITAIGTAFLALITIIGEVMKVARSNPVNSLCDE